MKKFKLFFASLILLFVISSCDESIKKVSEPTKITTVEILEHLPRDTVRIAKSEKVFYIMNKDNLVEYKLYADCGYYNNIVLLVLSFILFTLFGALIGVALEKHVNDSK